MTLALSPLSYSNASFLQPEQFFAATEMVHSLLQEIEMVVSTSRFGLRVLHKLVERAWYIYNKLNQRISRAETNSNWDDYDVYTKAIDPLEQILLEVLPVIYNYRVDSGVRVSSEDLMDLTEKWFTNNHTICEYFCRLGTLAEFQGWASSSRDLETELKDANDQDHSDLFNELLDEILDKVPQCTQPNLRVLFKYVIGVLQKVRNAYTRNTLQFGNEVSQLAAHACQWCTDSVKCAILTRGIMINLIQEPALHSLPDDYRWGGMIWTRVLGMVSRVNTALSSDHTMNTAHERPQQCQHVEELKPDMRPSTTENSYLLVPPHSESNRKSRAGHGLSVCTQLDDPAWVTFKNLQESFPDPHTPTHTQRLSRYRTHSPATAESISPVFSFSTSPVIAHTPALGWLPGLRTALALRTSASPPHAYSVCGQLPLYQFLGLGFRANS